MSRSNPTNDSGENLSDSATFGENTVFVQNNQIDPSRNPNIDSVQSIILKEGKRSRKIAKFTTILKQKTGEVHHYALNIKTFKLVKAKAGVIEFGEIEVPENSVSLTSEGDDEIKKLYEFLAATHEGLAAGIKSNYVILPTPESVDHESLGKLMRDLSSSRKIDVLTEILSFAANDNELFQTLIERVTKQPELFADAAAALNLVTYKNAFAKLAALINSPQKVNESQFQQLLSEHPWMFGSEYSELLDKRRLTRDENQDFVVRRTTDNYIEIIEIKTPLNGTNLFNYDSSHDSYYAASDLSKVLGQVQKYLEKLDADRNSILANDHEDTTKIRAKIIIGRDNDEKQCQALRRFNGHLYRIEIITFDQLLRIAENVLKYLESIIKPSSNISNSIELNDSEDLDIPF